LMVPLVDFRGGMRCSLEGGMEGEVRVVVESGSAKVGAEEVAGVFVGVGETVSALCREGARAVRRWMGVREGERKVPGFLDLFGWCTWDAFYQEVSAEKVREGLESFRSGGIVPKFVILDDGWQEVRDLGERRGKRLCGFAANEKFPGGLRETVRVVKGEFGVEKFFVWHAMGGYWGGADLEGMRGYGAEERERHYSEGVHHYVPTIESWWGTSAGVIDGDQAGAFFEGYHARLREEGVDGVKVDVQASLESVCGMEGRVRMYERYGRGLRGSVEKYFGGEGLINCMSCANDILYGIDGGVTRTSTDFWPNKPETHGLHVWTNAAVGLWFGEFVLPDWDMFQSGLEGGWNAFHAAARAVSGGPVYVSDKPGQQDFALLKKLVRADGRVLRCDGPGRLCRESLFRDPTKEEVLLKVWNTAGGGRAGVVGVFNCRHGVDEEIGGSVSPGDVETLSGEEFVMYLHNAGLVYRMVRREHRALRLGQAGWEIATIVPFGRVAVIGLLDKLNSYGGVRETGGGGNEVWAALRDGGVFGAYCAERPRRVAFEGREVAFGWQDGLLRVEIPAAGRVVVFM
jgi:raffinose synthase